MRQALALRIGKAGVEGLAIGMNVGDLHAGLDTEWVDAGEAVPAVGAGSLTIASKQ
jgi:hypothetical protein